MASRPEAILNRPNGAKDVRVAWVASLLCCLPAPARAGQIETVTFSTHVVRGTTNDHPVTIRAELYLPDKAKFPTSAVVVAPSSAGVSNDVEIYYAKRLTEAGIAALVVYSYASRELKDAMYDQSQLDSWDIENDAIAARGWLIADGRFEHDKIGILGMSNGGTAAMNSALEVRRRWSGVTNVAFAAHVAIAPDCTWVNRSAKTTGAPMLFLLAERDDQSPAKDCVAEAERLRQAGNDRIEMKIYKGAQHSWEDLGDSPYYDPDAENYSACRVWVEDDGSMIAADTGKRIPERSWHQWAKRHCMTLGTYCCGGTPELKRRATDDIIAFLKEQGF
jgi:dienelactone hydrolase